MTISKTHVSFEIPKSLQKKLDDLAKKSERTRSQIIRLAIKVFVEENGTK